MHAYSLIPLAALLVSAAFGAVSLAWDSDRRATRSMTALFACTGAWAFVELLAIGESDPERALVWLRWVHLPPLLIGPSVVWVLREISPDPPAHLAIVTRVGAVAALLLGLGAAIGGGGVQGVLASEIGWIPIYGSLSRGLIPVGTLLPLYAALVARPATRAGPPPDRSARARIRAMRCGVGVSIASVAVTEYVLPLGGVPFPRLGPLVTALCSAWLWLRALHQADDLRITPQGVARAMLARLHDGVVLVDLEGRILSTNRRFVELLGKPRARIVGGALADWLPIDPGRLATGLEDHPSMLRRLEDDPLAVSVSSSALHGGTGVVVGRIVVVRDRREIEALRTRLLESGRLAAIGELAAGIAHEVNNPIAFIRSDLNLLSRRLDEIERQAAKVSDAEIELAVLDRSRRRIAAALQGIERVATVVGDVRDFAHAGGATQGGSDPEAVVEAAMRLARMEREEEVAMRVVSRAGEGRIANGQELKQILLGLLRATADRLEKQASIEVDLRVDEDTLVIVLRAGPFGPESGDWLQALSRSGVVDGETGPGDFGVAAPGELLESIGGCMRARTTDDRHVIVEIEVVLVGSGGL